jgi:hypothetical protein
LDHFLGLGINLKIYLVVLESSRIIIKGIDNKIRIIINRMGGTVNKIIIIIMDNSIIINNIAIIIIIIIIIKEIIIIQLIIKILK